MYFANITLTAFKTSQFYSFYSAADLDFWISFKLSVGNFYLIIGKKHKKASLIKSSENNSFKIF